MKPSTDFYQYEFMPQQLNGPLIMQQQLYDRVHLALWSQVTAGDATPKRVLMGNSSIVSQDNIEIKRDSFMLDGFTSFDVIMGFGELSPSERPSSGIKGALGYKDDAGKRKV
ncbi:hypothetical protein KEM54_000375 [Ascosphaera aggregata]|nr:hypothetical protein KEM54_000375 [Ascosphaera aggregata]